MEIIVLVVGFFCLYFIIVLAIDNSKLTLQLKRNNELSQENNKVLKEIRNLMKENTDNTDGKKNLGHIIDEKR